MDKLKLILAALLVVAGIVGYYYFADHSQLFRVLGLLATIVVALVVVYFTAIGRQGVVLVGDVKTEVKKVVWPTPKEATQTTAVVVVVVMIVALFLWGVDSILLWAVRLLTGQGE